MVIIIAMRYESEENLRKAVEKTYGATLSESEWKHAKPGWNPPYDKEDVKDVMAKLSTKGHKRKAAHVPNWDADYIGGLNKGFVSLLQTIDLPSNLKRVGITLPIPLEELRGTLLQIGATNENNLTGLPLLYLKSVEMFPIGNLNQSPMEIETLYAPRDTLAETLAAFAHSIAAMSGYRYHPAEIITLWFCDIHIFPWEANFKVFKQGPTLEIRVNWVGVKPSSIAKAYSFARDSIIKEIRGKDTGKRTKPKKLSDRTQNLLEFCKERQNLKWEVKLQGWNQIFPDWKFPNVHLMAVVYSRAKKRKI